MFTKNIKDSFTANLLSAVSGVLGEAKKTKCAEGCECEACEAEDAEETKEGYMPTNDMPSAKDRATAGKLGALLKRERSTKEKKETNGVKTEETEVEEGYVSAAQRKAVWANRADDGKGHPDKKKMKKEEADMPFEKPYKKVGERKDEYGNKVKNVAKHLAKKAMKANEEVEELDEKRGLWDNIHAKRKRIKAGSGERMRKPGSEGAPTAADLKASQKEEVSLDAAFEQIDEISSDMAHRYLKGKRERDYDISADGKSSSLKKPQSFGKMNKDMKSTARALRTIEKAKKTNEEAEQIDEVSKATLGRYINKAKDSIDTASYRQGHKEAHGSSSKPLEKKLSKRHKGIETAVKKLTKEESEQIDEISKATLGSYIKKASGAEQPKNVMSPKNVPLTKIAAYQGDSETGHFGKRFNQATYDKAERLRKNRETGIKTAVNKLTKEESEQIDELSKDTMGRYINKAATKMGSQGVTAGLKIAADEKSSKNFKDMGKREKGIKLAVGKLTKEEQDFIDSLNAADMEQIDELSVKTLDQYRTKARQDIIDADDNDDNRMYNKRTKGYRAASKQVQKKLAKEEVDELEEARGRPRKAGARDFTIHPKTKEKLMHNNPADMARIERLQKNGILQKPKTEANQHVIQQLQRAKLSMRGGETINFTHGDPTHVSGTHASKLLDKYAGMKPDEKEAFQKKIGHSHAKLKSEL